MKKLVALAVALAALSGAVFLSAAQPAGKRQPAVRSMTYQQALFARNPHALNAQRLAATSGLPMCPKGGTGGYPTPEAARAAVAAAPTEPTCYADSSGATYTEIPADLIQKYGPGKFLVTDPAGPQWLSQIGALVGGLQARGGISDTVTPVIDSGVTPVQTASTIENDVLSALGDGSYITKVYVFAHHSEISAVVPTIVQDDGPEAALDGTVWVVLAHGPFEPIAAVNETDASPPARDVYAVFDDSDGTLIAQGTMASGGGCAAPCP